MAKKLSDLKSKAKDDDGFDFPECAVFSYEKRAKNDPEYIKFYEWLVSHGKTERTTPEKATELYDDFKAD